MAVGLLQEIRNEIRLVSMMESSDWEFELVCELKTMVSEDNQVSTSVYIPAQCHQDRLLRSNVLGP